MAANTSDTTENAPFIVPEGLDEKLYTDEVADIAKIRQRLEHLHLVIQSEEAAAGTRDSKFNNPAFNNASASTDSIATSIENLSLDEKKELRADLELRLSQLLAIVTYDKKNPVKIKVENELREIEMQRREDEAMDRVYHRGMKWTIGVAIGFGLMCIMLPATALLLVQKGII